MFICFAMAFLNLLCMAFVGFNWSSFSAMVICLTLAIACGILESRG